MSEIEYNKLSTASLACHYKESIMYNDSTSRAPVWQKNDENKMAHAVRCPSEWLRIHASSDTEGGMRAAREKRRRLEVYSYIIVYSYGFIVKYIIIQ